MFEHLGPAPEVGMYRPGPKYKLYLSLLFLAILGFIFSAAISRGPSSRAMEPEILSSEVLVDSSDKKIVSSAKNFPIFDFVVEVDNANTSLYKLNILVEGIYDLNLLKDLKLFHENVQLGQIEQIDSTGKIYFDLKEYQLPVGQNRFSLFFSSGDSLKDSPVLKFSIPTKDDIFLISSGQVFRPRADFPVSSGLISISDQGQIMASNSYIIDDFIVDSEVPQPVSSFELRSIGEKADLKQIILSYQNLSDGADTKADFFLSLEGAPIAQASSQDGQIIFDIKKGILLEELSRKIFELHTFALPEGSYQFSLDNVSAQGVWSGADIGLPAPIALSQVEARAYFMQFQAKELDQRLTEGWNKIYNLQISARGAKTLYLNKFTWSIAPQNLDITALEIWYSGQPYIADIIFEDGQVIVKTDGQDPLPIGQEPTELLLLAKVENIKNKAKIEAFILPDDSPLDQENIFGHIIWSDGQDFYNGYKMPYLPLQPSILNN